MTNFSDLDIKVGKAFVGDKINIDRLLNIPIQVLDYSIEDSKKNPGTKCLHMQILFENQKRVVFIGAKVLMAQIQQTKPENFPLDTTIKKPGMSFMFT